MNGERVKRPPEDVCLIDGFGGCVTPFCHIFHFPPDGTLLLTAPTSSDGDFCDCEDEYPTSDTRSSSLMNYVFFCYFRVSVALLVCSLQALRPLSMCAPRRFVTCWRGYAPSVECLPWPFCAPCRWIFWSRCTTPCPIFRFGCF